MAGEIMTKDQAAWYLAAMIDGEGCIYFNAAKRRYSIQVTNTDVSILEAIEKSATVLGLRHGPRSLVGVGTGRSMPCWNIRLLGGMDTMRDVLRMVPIQSERKKATLLAIIASYRELPPRPSTEWLQEHYMSKLWIAKRIASEWSVNTRTVYHWLDNAGIPRRNKQEAALIAAAMARERAA